MITAPDPGLTGGGCVLKPYTPKQLCALYGVSPRTMRRWMEPLRSQLGERRGHFYNVNQVRLILHHLGIPGQAMANCETI